MNKTELLDWLQEEYQQWQAFLGQIDPGLMDQPGVAGDWSIKDIVAHLTDWQPRQIARIQAAQRGEPEPAPPWPAHLQTDDEVNAWIYTANHGRSVGEVLEEAHHVFQQTLAVIGGLPDDIVIEPAYHIMQLNGQRFSMSEFFDHFHDDHEAEIHAWLARVEKQ
jgi:hypothetical protein